MKFGKVWSYEAIFEVFINRDLSYTYLYLYLYTDTMFMHFSSAQFFSSIKNWINCKFEAQRRQFFYFRPYSHETFSHTILRYCDIAIKR